MKYMAAILPYEDDNTQIKYSVFETRTDAMAALKVLLAMLGGLEKEELEEMLDDFDGDVMAVLDHNNDGEVDYCAFIYNITKDRVVYQAGWGVEALEL